MFLWHTDSFLQPKQPWVKTVVTVLSVNAQHNWSWKMWNLMDTTVDTERTVTTIETVQKEYWRKQRRNFHHIAIKKSKEKTQCYIDWIIEFLPNVIKLASRFKFVIDLTFTNLPPNRLWPATHSRVFFLFSMSSTANVFSYGSSYIDSNDPHQSLVSQNCSISDTTIERLNLSCQIYRLKDPRRHPLQLSIELLLIRDLDYAFLLRSLMILTSRHRDFPVSAFVFSSISRGWASVSSRFIFSSSYSRRRVSSARWLPFPPRPQPFWVLSTLSIVSKASSIRSVFLFASFIVCQAASTESRGRTSAMLRARNRLTSDLLGRGTDSRIYNMLQDVAIDGCTKM